jgi:glycosyltransferase involved in cell wall biosynthesis
VVRNKKKHRIALVVPGLANGREGGIPSVAAFLFHVLSNSERYHPHVISLATSSKDPYSVRLLSPSSWFHGVQTTSFSWKGVPATHVGASFTEFEFQRYRPRRPLVKLLNEYDLVQIVAGSPAPGVLSRKISPPVVIQVATLAAVERATMLRRQFNFRGVWSNMMTRVTNRLDQEALQFVDHIFVENHWMYHYCERRLGPQRVTLAPPGIDTEIFSPLAAFPENGFILSVGRFSDPRKNVALLFKAYHALIDLIPDPPSLVLAGGSMPDPRDWRFAQDLGISERVQLFENVSTSELAQLYRQARLFVLSSNEEGFGIVLLEAMASGVPVIATRCGGPEGLIANGETGYLVPTADFQALTERIVALLQDTALSRRMGQKGRNFILARYSEEAAGRAFLNTYDSLLGK